RAHRLAVRATDGDAHRAGEAYVDIAVASAVHRREDDDGLSTTDRLAAIAAETWTRGVTEPHRAVADDFDLAAERLGDERRRRQQQQQRDQPMRRHGAHRLMRSRRNF